MNNQAAASSTRSYWVQTMLRIADPVLTALADKQLRATMPVENKKEEQRQYSHLEAFARTLVGISPWLETPALDAEEEKLRTHYVQLVRTGLDAATDPESPDFMNFSHGFQPIVDTAFLSHAILRAPNTLWHGLESRVQSNLVQALKATRTRKPGFNNWLLFAAMTETALRFMGEDWDQMRVDFALKQHEQWYLGDGMYGDGPHYHADYYNSFVIQPMLVDIIEHVDAHYEDWAVMRKDILARAQRYAAVQERSISPEGTFPVIGRSLAYRFGAFQSLAQTALRRELPVGVSPSQVRCALSAIITRLIEAPGTFDEKGWLTIGLCGHQPELGEPYISTGSLYLCSAVFLPLGLPADDAFWSDADAPWTSQKVWSGQTVAIDKAI
ncbi:DUF2264 domain-containing protein [Paenibacillus sp. CGMCC 1.16610]|uniref:DUF2264 domain-containing protein n=1 Tax=Paenibacillus anseongense TaxID=2682845 RepID=A0ABW9UAY3_9BACL|nr:MULTISPECIES: DUF2264 domain-containing protein [Paenibacillus]MBA2942075.1 DUF2264 domain-containing protein [Paenibacillus sp. CGMCC 1.16610]MVQ35908.1 DUF2264 domain-containing protein [Paenibacillus anseongense]